jgi:hypothetical protein
MYYKIPPELLTEILNELTQKPWGLVNNVIVKLSKLEKVEEKLDNKVK